MRYAITDIHGCPQTLRYALDTINYDPAADQLFFLGDYVDRGPDSQGVIDIVRDLQAENPATVALRGNHEEMILDVLNGTRHPWDWEPKAEYMAGFAAWINALPHYHLLPDYILVHAGLNFRAHNPLDDKHAMLWERYWYQDIDVNRQWLGTRIIVHGHTPATMLQTKRDIRDMRMNQYVCIDSGCSQEKEGMGYLTVLNLDTGEGTFVRRIDKM